MSEPFEVDSPMGKWKHPQPIDFVTAATSRYSFRNWQSGNDDSVYYNLNIPSFFMSRVVMPSRTPRPLERDLRRDLLTMTFTDHEGDETEPLSEYLVGPRQVQAMLMAHRGRVVFEAYPGMNPTDMHVWMSASKTTASLLATMLWEDGRLDFEQPVSAYVTDLQGTVWDGVTMANAMNMAAGLDIEETFENLINPESWISRFFTAVFEGTADWRHMLRLAETLPGEPPGSHFRYSSAITMVLVLAVEQITQKPWQAFWDERVWSRIGVSGPFIIGLTPDGTPIAAGMNNTTPEDMLRYALTYTPSWGAVADRQVVSDAVLTKIQTLGDPSAYRGSTEEVYGTKWFGETPDRNTAQWDHAFADGALFKHGNMGQGIYVDPARDFCGIYFGLATNDESVAGIDHSPGYLRKAAKVLAGG